jgi:Zn-dependent protease
MNFNFRLGSIPVRVDGSFLLVILFLGLSGRDPAEPIAGIVQWIVIAFVGVLLHELGHALVGRSFGLVPRIDLAGFGGLTSWGPGKAPLLGPAKRIAISLAGPFTGIVIGGGALALTRARAGFPPLAFFDGHVPLRSLSPLVYAIVFVNAGWGVLNLLPVLPMDGGNVLFQSLNWLTKGHGEKPARIISSIVAAGAGLLALLNGQIYAACFAGIFAAQNVMALRPPPGDRPAQR